jgi:cytochrome P450
MIDLFLAGMETTASSLMWTFLYMIHHPDIQKRVHQELDEVKKLNISILNVANLPFLEKHSVTIEKSSRIK